MDNPAVFTPDPEELFKAFQLNKFDEDERKRQLGIRDSELAERMRDPEVARNLYGEEFEKHVAAMRERYPMLMSLFLSGPASQNANLSNIATTNKYARLADAYNAQLRYAPTAGSGIVGDPSQYRGANPNWEQVPQLNTQDQKQMELLRETQGALRTHQLGEEQYYNKQFYDKKMEEMKKVLDQMYKQQFFQSDEAMRQTSALFDSWSKMNEQEFEQMLTHLQIPSTQAKRMIDLYRQGRYLEAAQAANAMKLTPMELSQIYAYQMGGRIVKGMLDGSMDQVTAGREIGKLTADQLIGAFEGILSSAEARDPRTGKLVHPEAADLAVVARKAIREGTSIANTAVGVAKGGLIAAAIFMVIKSMMGVAADAVKIFGA